MVSLETPVDQLKNIGPKSAEWLHEIGIVTLRDLQKAGAVLSYKMLQHRFKGINVLMLYGLYGALNNRHWNSLSPTEKDALKREAEEAVHISFGDTDR